MNMTPSAFIGYGFGLILFAIGTGLFLGIACAVGAGIYNLLRDKDGK